MVSFVKKLTPIQLKRFISTLLCIGLLLGIVSGTGLLTGCSQSNIIVITIYNENSSEAGYLTGWYADEVRDRFGIQIKYANANDEGFMSYVTSGDLGDIIILNSAMHYHLARNSGVLLDWNENNYLTEAAPTLAKDQAASFEKNRSDNEDGCVYGLYSNVALTDELHSLPSCIYLNYQYYKALGCPEIANLSELSDLLTKMTDLATQETGQQCYAICTSDDDDYSMPLLMEDLLKIYGYSVFGLGVYNEATDDYQEILTENGIYTKLLNFCNELATKNLINPAYAYQNFETVDKYYENQLAMLSFSDRTGYIPVQIQDATPNVYLYDPAGRNNIISIGAYSAHPVEAMQLLEWMYSVEGYLTYLYGPQGTCWDYDKDGEPCLTEFGIKCMKNPEVTVMKGKYSGYFGDGRSLLRTDMWDYNSPMPNQAEGITFNYLSWPSTKQGSSTITDSYDAWKNDYQVTSTTDYLSTFHYNIIPSSSYSLPEYDTEIALPYSQVRSVIRIHSWDYIWTQDTSMLSENYTDMDTAAREYRYDVVWDFFSKELENYKKSLQH